jgi:hypothetical protein
MFDYAVELDNPLSCTKRPIRGALTWPISTVFILNGGKSSSFCIWTLLLGWMLEALWQAIKPLIAVVCYPLQFHSPPGDKTHYSQYPNQWLSNLRDFKEFAKSRCTVLCSSRLKVLGHEICVLSFGVQNLWQLAGTGQPVKIYMNN